MLSKIAAFTGLVAIAMQSFAAPAHAYPTKPVTLVVGFAAGGTGDQVSRILQPEVEKILGQPIVIENRSGAGGGLAAAHVARAPADGYTVWIPSNNQLVINVNLSKNPGYDPVNDFASISKVGSQANILVVNSSLEAKTLGELVALTKANPGKYSYASAGVGTIGHLAGELLKLRSGADITHVPYRGSAPAAQSVVAGQVQMAFGLIPPMMPYLKSQVLRAVAEVGPKRSAMLPDVPTISESGYAGADAATWHGLFVPAGTPRAVIDILHRAFTTALGNPEVRQRLLNIGVEVETSSPEELDALIRAEIPRWAEIIAAAGIKTE